MSRYERCVVLLEKIRKHCAETGESTFFMFQVKDTLPEDAGSIRYLRNRGDVAMVTRRQVMVDGRKRLKTEWALK